MTKPEAAQVDVMFAVNHGDKHDRVEVVAVTRELAEQYIAGQWSDEYYSIEPVKVIRALPEPRPLYTMTGRVFYNPTKPDKRQVDDWNEFPGLGNGEGIPLGEVVSDMHEYSPWGWDVSATGWDRVQTEMAFDERLAEAYAARTTRLAAFHRFPPGTVVRAADGKTMIRAHDADHDARCWHYCGRIIYDIDVAPDTLTIIAEGGE